VGGTLSISGTALTTLADLRSLRTVSGTLAIANHAALLHVNVLPALTTVGALSIGNNAVLPACDAEGLLAFLKARGFTGTATLDKNAGTGTCK
jgi:hypothetical protein